MIPPPWTPKQINHPGTITHVIDGADGYTPDMLRQRKVCGIPIVEDPLCPPGMIFAINTEYIHP